MRRDRDPKGRARNARPRDVLGRPLAREAVHALPEEHLPDDPEMLMRIGADHFNAGRYFQAHEAWEAAWHPSPAGERSFWRGITQIAVGFTHLQRGNLRGAVSLLRRGAAAVDRYGESFRGFPCADIAARARAAAEAIGAGGQVEPPLVRL